MIINVYSAARRQLLSGFEPSAVPATITVQLYTNPFIFYPDFGADPLGAELPNANGYTRQFVDLAFLGDIGLAIGTDYVLPYPPPIQRVQLGANGAAIQCISAAWVATGPFAAAHALIRHRSGGGLIDLYHLDLEGLVTWPVGELYGFTFDAEGLVTYKAA